MEKKGYLLIEDGTIVVGELFGDLNVEKSFAELVFNTSMTGYQEILTDPSYFEQTIVLTYPEVGNYGVNDDFSESDKIFASGLIVKNLCDKPSHWKNKKTLDDFMRENRKLGLKGVDTRFLARKLSTEGAKKCVISSKYPDENLRQELKAFRLSENMQEVVSTNVPVSYKRGEKRLCVVDLGCKKNIINLFLKNDISVELVPFDISSDWILKNNFDAVLLSNGPGDPKNCLEAIEMTRSLIGRLPIFGICLGFQIISIVLGAKTYKLKFGHRGGNHPCINLLNNKVVMTSQNHGYAVDETTLPTIVDVSYKNLNDNTLEGIVCHNLDIEAVQFHPEANPGPCDCRFIFESWVEKIKARERCLQNA